MVHLAETNSCFGNRQNIHNKKNAHRETADREKLTERCTQRQAHRETADRETAHRETADRQILTLV